MSPTALGSRYLLDEPIGRGGMGVVWRGRDRVSDAVYAIKVLRPEIADDPSAVARFVRERTALVKFRHPNVVTVHDMIVEGDRLALVMNLVAGGNLDQLRRERGGQLEQTEASRLIAQVASGLAAAHAAGIVHRDLKPTNMLVSVEDDEPQVQLADFGIARLAGQAPVTTEGSVLGTAAYLAPEAIQGGEPGSESDVYGLGITLYELLTGHPPFTGAVGAILHAHVSAQPKPVPGVRGELRSLIQKCLAKDPSSRPSAAQVADELERIADGDNVPARGRLLQFARRQEDPEPGTQTAHQNQEPHQNQVPVQISSEQPAPADEERSWASVRQLPDPPQHPHTSVFPAARGRSAWWLAMVVGGAALVAAVIAGVALLVWPTGGSHAGNPAANGKSSRLTPAKSSPARPSAGSTPSSRPLSWRCGHSTRQQGGTMHAQACIAVQGTTVHIKGYLWRVPSNLSSGDFEQLHIVLKTSAGLIAQYTSHPCSPGRCEYSASMTASSGTYRARADFYFDQQNEFQSEYTPYITVP